MKQGELTTPFLHLEIHFTVQEFPLVLSVILNN